MRCPRWTASLNGSIIRRMSRLVCAPSWEISARGKQQRLSFSPESFSHNARRDRMFLCPFTSIFGIWTSIDCLILVCVPYWSRCSARVHRQRSMWIMFSRSSPLRDASSSSTAWTKFLSTSIRARDKNLREDFCKLLTLLSEVIPLLASCSPVGASISAPSRMRYPFSRDRIESAFAVKTTWFSLCCPSMKSRS